MSPTPARSMTRVIGSVLLFVALAGVVVVIAAGLPAGQIWPLLLLCAAPALIALSLLTTESSKDKRQMAFKERHRREKQRKNWLTQSVRTYLLPALMRQGFEVGPLRELTPPIDRDWLWCFPPWGRLIRTRGAVVDLVEIQFDSLGRAAFRINAGVAPKDGLTTRAGHRNPEEMGVHFLEEWFETHARPWMRPGMRALRLEPLGAWFSVWHWPWRSPTQDDYEKLAVRAAGLVPEVEAALCEGRLGPHILRVVFPWSRRPRPHNIQQQ